jgi:polyisoprenoid-binding protein YceI
MWDRLPHEGRRRMKNASALLVCALAMAQPARLEIDPARTSVEFTLGSTLHTVHGTFALKRSSMQFDPVSGKIEGEVAIDATSGESGNESRDRKMHREILESAKYPEIVFRPDQVEGTLAPLGASQVKLRGMLTIHGGEHEIVVPVDVQAGGGKYQAAAHFDVPYVQWGMKNPSTFILRVEKSVAITVHAQL